MKLLATPLKNVRVRPVANESDGQQHFLLQADTISIHQLHNSPNFFIFNLPESGQDRSFAAQQFTFVVSREEIFQM
ncbi:MAG: hypothetical protein IH612_06210, partial [Desulfofustis sp.]|nr:hypothetical protein [Desulfofustis sp.]